MNKSLVFSLLIMKKTMYRFSLALLMALSQSILAMNNQPETPTHPVANQAITLIIKQQEPELTGLAHLVDRSGTLAQYCLVPAAYGIKTGDIPGTVALVAVNAITSNLCLLLLGGKKSKLKPFAHTDTETAAQFAARSGANGVIHLTNQGIKILASIAPLYFLGKIGGKVFDAQIIKNPEAQVQLAHDTEMRDIMEHMQKMLEFLGYEPAKRSASEKLTQLFSGSTCPHCK